MKHNEMVILTGADKAVVSRISFLEKKYNVMISLLSDGVKLYMSVIANDASWMEADIVLSSCEDDKYATMTAMRNYFIKKFGK